MAEYLFIRLSGDGDCTSMVLDADGRVVRSPAVSSLDTIASATENRKVVVLVPGADVLTTRAELPAVSQARLRQLLPFSMEDALAEDVDGMHFAAGKREGDQVNVVAVSRERMDEWTARLADAGIEAQAMYAETDGVPDTPSTLNLLVEGTRVFGRQPGHAPFVYEGLRPSDIAALVAAEAEEDSGPQHVMVYLGGPADPDLAADLSALRGRVQSLDLKELVDGALPRLASILCVEPGTNLLQGSYARKSNWGALARPWYVAASLLFAALAVMLVVQAAEFFTLRGEDRRLAASLSERCAQSVGAQDLSACGSEVRRRLTDAGASPAAGSEGFLTTLAAVAEYSDAASTVEALSYRNEVMDLRVITPSVTALEDFRQQIVGTNRFEVRVESTTPGDEGIEGRLQIVEAAQ